MSATSGADDGFVVAIAHVDFSPRQILEEAGRHLAGIRRLGRCSRGARHHRSPAVRPGPTTSR